MRGTGISVFDDLIIKSNKSVFMQVNKKIEGDSIYDNHPKQKNGTRFGGLPTKLEKTNKPVTFHKQIKSSGYSNAPSSLKYTSKAKQKAQQAGK